MLGKDLPNERLVIRDVKLLACGIGCDAAFMQLICKRLKTFRYQLTTTNPIADPFRQFFGVPQPAFHASEQLGQWNGIEVALRKCGRGIQH